jgi:hypothetical protein
MFSGGEKNFFNLHFCYRQQDNGDFSPVRNIRFLPDILTLSGLVTGLAEKSQFSLSSRGFTLSGGKCSVFSPRIRAFVISCPNKDSWVRVVGCAGDKS